MEPLKFLLDFDWPEARERLFLIIYIFFEKLILFFLFVQWRRRVTNQVTRNTRGTRQRKREILDLRKFRKKFKKISKFHDFLLDGNVDR